MSHRSRGQAILEFLLVTSALAAALLLPVAGGRSIAAILLGALSSSLAAQAFIVSIL